MIIQEDKAPAHNSKYQQEVFNFHKILYLLWPGNSPDINIIKPYWPSIKRGLQKPEKKLKNFGLSTGINSLKKRYKIRLHVFLIIWKKSII